MTKAMQHLSLFQNIHYINSLKAKIIIIIIDCRSGKLFVIIEISKLNTSLGRKQNEYLLPGSGRGTGGAIHYLGGSWWWGMRSTPFTSVLWGWCSSWGSLIARLQNESHVSVHCININAVYHFHRATSFYQKYK